MKSEDYCQGDAFQAEKRTIFSTSWLPLCAAGQVAKPGDFLAASVGGWSVMAVCDQAGAVRVLRNACRHQNMPVANAGAGTCQNFRCRFHGWTYGLDGKFLSAPPPVAPSATQTERDLIALPSAEPSGLIFFAIEKLAAPEFAVPHAAYVGTTATDIDCNWKVCVEYLMGKDSEFVWPLLFVQGAVVHQVVPHTFLRTRLFTHVFGDGAADTTAIKQACETLQAERAAGTMPADSDFHRRLTAAYDGSS